MVNQITPTKLSEAAGISVPYASQIIRGEREPSPDIAVRIFRTIGIKFPPIAHLDNAEIDAVEKMLRAA